MKKIISLFKRNYDGDYLVRNEVVSGAEWVINGEGIATIKWDGTSCLIKDNEIYKRYDAKKGKKPPEDFLPAQEPDINTGHWPGWVKINSNDYYHIEAFDRLENKENGTYELCGPKIQKNPERFTHHILVKHGNREINAPRNYDELKEWFKDKDIEGIVWHNKDGRMVKIKKKDFGYKR